jgi:hypothetical protein
MLTRINESQIRSIIKKKLLENYKRKILKENAEDLTKVNGSTIDLEDQVITQFFAILRDNKQDTVKNMNLKNTINSKKSLLSTAGFSGFANGDDYGNTGDVTVFALNGTKPENIIAVNNDDTIKNGLNADGWKIIKESIAQNKVGLYVHIKDKKVDYILVRKWKDETSEHIKDILEDVYDDVPSLSSRTGWINDDFIVDYLADDTGDVMQNTEFMIFKTDSYIGKYIITKDTFIKESLKKIQNISTQQSNATQTQQTARTVQVTDMTTSDTPDEENQSSSTPDEENQSSSTPDEENQSSSTPDEENDTPIEKVSALFRIPQLNGGYFELAKILLNESRMNELQDITTGGYKPKQIERNLIKRFKQYGPTDVSKIPKIVSYLTDDTNKIITQFINDINTTNPNNSVNAKDIISNITNERNLGKYLADFYMHQMFKVSQFIIISAPLFTYLYQRALGDIAGAKGTLKDCENVGLNKVLKPDININTALSQIGQTEGAVNISLEKMFQGRADKNATNYNSARSSEAMHGAQDEENEASLRQKNNYNKNMNRMRGSARLAKANPMR